MTEPTWEPVPAPVSDLTNLPRWYSSREEYRSTTLQPLCPVCLDFIRRAS